MPTQIMAQGWRTIGFRRVTMEALADARIGVWMMQDILDLLRRLRDSEEPCALATVVETRGSVSARTGSKAIVDRHGKVIAGWVGGGCAQSTVCQDHAC